MYFTVKFLGGGQRTTWGIDSDKPLYFHDTGLSPGTRQDCHEYEDGGVESQNMGLAWTCETLQPISSDTLPPSVPYPLILLK